MVPGAGIMVNDIWGWTDPLTGIEYALVGRMDGMAFISLEDPARPVYVGQLLRPHLASVSAWRDVKVYADHAFVVADAARQHGLQVFDLRQLRDVAEPPVTFEETARYDRIASAHNIVINEESGFAYAVGNSAGGETCGGGLHMIDIHDPDVRGVLRRPFHRLGGDRVHPRRAVHPVLRPGRRLPGPGDLPRL